MTFVTNFKMEIIFIMAFLLGGRGIMCLQTTCEFGSSGMFLESVKMCYASD